MSYDKLKNSCCVLAVAVKDSVESAGFPLFLGNRFSLLGNAPVPMENKSHSSSVSKA
jgi:hypothetical protein